MEIWKGVEGFEGLYDISNLGRVKSLECYKMRSNGRNQYWKETILTPRLRKKGYFNVSLRNYSIVKDTPIHRLVAIHFVLNPNNYKEVNHIDGNKKNNHFTNLEWCSRSHNVQHAFDNGLKFGYSGEDHPKSILSEKDVLSIRLNKDNCSRSILAQKYGVSKSAISFIIQRRSWKHI